MCLCDALAWLANDQLAGLDINKKLTLVTPILAKADVILTLVEDKCLLKQLRTIKDNVLLNRVNTLFRVNQTPLAVGSSYRILGRLRSLWQNTSSALLPSKYSLKRSTSSINDALLKFSKVHSSGSRLM